MGQQVSEPPGACQEQVTGMNERRQQPLCAFVKYPG